MAAPRRWRSLVWLAALASRASAQGGSALSGETMLLGRSGFGGGGPHTNAHASHFSSHAAAVAGHAAGGATCCGAKRACCDQTFAPPLEHACPETPCCDAACEAVTLETVVVRSRIARARVAPKPGEN